MTVIYNNYEVKYKPMFLFNIRLSCFINIASHILRSKEELHLYRTEKVKGLVSLIWLLPKIVFRNKIFGKTLQFGLFIHKSF